MTVDFQTFLGLIYKFTSSQKSRIGLDAAIVDGQTSRDHLLVLWAIKDPGLRQGKDPYVFPKYQRGIWTCSLENVLTQGVSDEWIKRSRYNLKLDLRHGIDDDYFFHVPIYRVDEGSQATTKGASRQARPSFDSL